MQSKIIWKKKAEEDGFKLPPLFSSFGEEKEEGDNWKMVE
jgi:hypothetical protein